MMPNIVYAVTILLLVCLPVCVHGYATVVVNKDGNDEEGCVTGETPCKTLHYALKELSVTQLETKDVTIIVEYSQPIQSINISYSFQLNVTVLGVGQPSLICENNGFLHFSSQNNTGAAISFDGVTFSNCNGYWNGYEWITGYTFLNFDIVSLQNVILTNNSDIFFAGNTFVSIVNCLFQDNAYHNGLIYISVTDTDGLADNSTSYNIEHSIFISNIGLAESTSINHLATVAAIVTATNKQTDVDLFISACEFHDNQIVDPELNHTQANEIGINVAKASLNFLNITIKDSKFHNDSASAFSRIINIACEDTELGTVIARIQSNLFVNNSLTEAGEITAFNFKNVILMFPTTIEYTFNNASFNLGNCLSIRYSNMSHPKFAIVQYSSFVGNYGKAVYVHCGICEPVENTVNMSNVEVIGNTIPFIQTGT